MSKIMTQIRGFAKMAAAMSATQPTNAPATTQPAGPPAFLPPLVDELDLWDYMASVSTTDGMKTVEEQVVVLREGAKTKTLGQVFYRHALHPIEPHKRPPNRLGATTRSSGHVSHNCSAIARWRNVGPRPSA
jgi:hypothetical protein